jgi:hypothetical protein
VRRWSAQLLIIAAHALLKELWLVFVSQQQASAPAPNVLRVFFTDETYISLPAKADTTALDLVNQVCRRRNLLDTASDFALFVLDKSQKEGRLAC